MPEGAQTRPVATMNYEHRKKDGTLVSRGKQIVNEEKGQIVCTQEGPDGVELSRLCFDLEGQLLEKVVGGKKQKIR